MRRLQLRSMRRRRRLDRPARRLSVSIDALPRATKLAMLEGIRETPIFVGAYTSVDGTCPMFAAHRRGGRTPRDVRARLVGYTRAERGPRPATERELRAVEAMLEASLAAEEGRGPGDLGRAIGAHREARERRVEREEAAADAEGRPGRSRQRSASTAAADGPADGDRSTSCVAARAGPGGASSDASTTTRPPSRRSSLARSRRAPANLTTRRFPTPEPLRPNAASTPRRSEAPVSQPARP
jgi:hypothetical protein